MNIQKIVYLKILKLKTSKLSKLQGGHKIQFFEFPDRFLIVRQISLTEKYWKRKQALNMIIYA